MDAPDRLHPGVAALGAAHHAVRRRQQASWQHPTGAQMAPPVAGWMEGEFDAAGAELLTEFFAAYWGDPDPCEVGQILKVELREYPTPRRPRPCRGGAGVGPLPVLPRPLPVLPSPHSEPGHRDYRALQVRGFAGYRTPRIGFYEFPGKPAPAGLWAGFSEANARYGELHTGARFFGSASRLLGNRARNADRSGRSWW